METTTAFEGLACIDCGARHDPASATHRCPDCEGVLDPRYDLDGIDLDPAGLDHRGERSMWRYEDVLPFSRAAAVTLEEGWTPLVECPALAAEFDLGRLLVKDEGRNPTGAFKDRGQSVAVTAARQHGATDVALASAGNAGQAAAAYAARADLDAHVFLPSRAGFATKAMVNVHGADLTVVGGRLRDAGAAYADAMDANDDWYGLQTFETPYRHEGKKTMYYEIVEQLDWQPPDAIVYPTGGGVGLVGMYKAAMELRELGLIEELPALYAVQATGCAPIVDAWEAGADRHEPVAHPDTICGGLEVDDPGASEWILEAIAETGGGAVATTDDEILQAAVGMASGEGLGMSPTAGAAASGAWELCRRGAFEADDTVVLMNTAAATKAPDVLRSHLMGQGI